MFFSFCCNNCHLNMGETQLIYFYYQNSIYFICITLFIRLEIELVISAVDCKSQFKAYYKTLPLLTE